MRITLLATFLLIFTGVWAENIPTDAADVLKLLDDAICLRSYYMGHRQNRIDSMAMQLKGNLSASERLRLVREIADTYYAFQIDSAVAWYNRGESVAEAVGNESERLRFELKRISVLPVIGAVHEGVNRFEALRPSSIPDELKMEFYEAGTRMYLFTLDYYRTDSLRMRYIKPFLALNDSILPYLTPGTTAYAYYSELNHLLHGENTAMALGTLTKVFEGIEPSDPYYSRIAMTLMHHYQSTGNHDKALYYLAKTALADALTGTREESALLNLGREMYDRGDLDRAYLYLRTSIENSVSSGAASRTLQASRTFPLIAAAVNAEDDRRIGRMTALAVALFLALVCIAVVGFYLRYERNSIERMRRRLAEANKVKETYISEFLNLSTIHMDKLEEFHRTALRKLKAGQADDLLKQLASGREKTDQIKTFYEIFDNAFLHIYPNFIEGVNRLFLPERRLHVADDNHLTTELRILAFMRLGITDGTRMARFLGVAVNTVYTYRNKFRSLAISRDTFEYDLMQIDAIG